MFGKLKSFALRVKREIQVYYLVLKDSRTPKPAKVVLWLAVGYAFLPFDIIPDFIPVLGQLDDIIIVPGLIFVALMMVPKEIVEDRRKQIEGGKIGQTK